MTFSGKCMGFVCEFILKKNVFARTHVSYHETDNLKIPRLTWNLNELDMETKFWQ